jgi:hypothetical protein
MSWYVATTRGDDARGAVAVETALLLSFLLAPLLLGVLYYGAYFWKAQSAPVLDTSIDQAGFVGTFCTGRLPELVDRVRSAVLLNVQNLDQGTALPVSLGDITATVVGYVPDGLGVDVAVSITSKVLSHTLSILPVPGDGSITTDAMIRLENIKISTGSC